MQRKENRRNEWVERRSNKKKRDLKRKTRKRVGDKRVEEQEFRVKQNKVRENRGMIQQLRIVVVKRSWRKKERVEKNNRKERVEEK